LDFNGESSVVVKSSIQSVETAASVADCYGELLFYTDGETVWGSENSRMDGGFDLRGVGSSYPSSQGALIVKRPNSPSIYYIFTASDIYGVNYSIINMQANAGQGKVIQKNINLSGSLTQKLGVTYHQNGKDIWVITHYQNSNVYECFLVTKTGVSPSTIKSITGPEFTSSHGDIKFNQQGTKVGAVVQDQSLITLADFNNSTGKVSNSYGIIGQYNNPHGCEFSPSGNKFYVTAWGTNGGVIQFKVTGSNSTTLSENEVNISGAFKPSGSLQLAPNGKIYVAHEPGLLSTRSYLGIINFPEKNGSSAVFKRKGVDLGRSGSSWELPNVTLTNKEVPELNQIKVEQFCFNSETKFNLNSLKGIIDVTWNFDDPSSGVFNYANEFDPSHTFSSPGSYLVKATVQNNCAVEEYYKTVVIDEGPISSLNSLSTCSLTDTEIGFSPKVSITYSWNPPEGLSATNVSNPIFNSNGLEGDKFQYTLISSSPGGCKFKDTLDIQLYKKEKALGDQILCPGFGVTLSVDSGVSSAKWEGISIKGLNSLSPYVNPSFSSDYVVELTDTNGCVLIDTVFVDVNPNVLVDAGIDTSVCIGDSIAIGNDISRDSTFFSWDPGLLVVDSTSGETFSFPKSSQWFYLTAVNDTCSSKDSIFIKVNELPDVFIAPDDTSVCFDDTISFSANANLDYNWFQNELFIKSGNEYQLISDNSTNIILEGIDSNKCKSRDTSVVTVLPLPDIKTNNDTAICIGQGLNLFVSGGDDYIWLNNELTGVLDSFVFVFPEKTLSYKVKANGNNGCYALDSIQVIVNSLPSVRLMKDTLICKGSNAYLWATGGVNYSWSPSTFLNRTIGNQVLSIPKIPISYEVVVTDSNGCVDSAETSVSLNDVPIADFSFNYIPSCAGFEVQFSDSSLLTDTYQWIFGDGTTSNQMNPYHIFNFGTNVSTVLTVGNNGICFDKANVDFEWKNISEFLDVFLPNIITPNNDGINDCFEVIVPKEFVECTHYEIYNRWGMKVYDTKEFKNNFCGINAYNNKEVSAGTYYYTVEVGDYLLNGFVKVEIN
jgi:gliding motility-associated-like protein